MAISFVNVGAFNSGTGALSNIAVPANTQLGDLLLILLESANETIATPTTTVGTWTQIGNQANQATGTAAATGGVRLAVYYKWWQTGQTASAVADSGNHTCAQIIAYRGVDRLNPFVTSASGTQATLTAGNLTLPAVTTTIPNAEILFCVANDRDLVNTTSFDNLTNANLTSINERIDQTIATGVGGGLALYEATAPLAGNIGTSTLVKNAGFTTTATAAYLTIALRPKRRLSLFT